MTVKIDLVADYTGNKAFKRAEKDVFNLEKSAKKLGKAFGLALSTAAVVSFGKASVKAFAEDEAAAVKLGRALDNLGIGFMDVRAEKFIKDLETTAHVADDILRPAFQALLQTTGDYYASQKLLTQSLDISRGSGVDLATVSQDLANAYVGNTKGLKKYNLGLTQAELKTISFTDLMAKFNSQFAGQNAAYLETYAGRLEALTVASGNVKEAIGQGILDGIKILSGDSTITDLTSKMESLGVTIANYIRGVAYYVRKLLDSPIVQAMLKAAMWLAKHTGAAAILDAVGTQGAKLAPKETKQDAISKAQAAALKKAQADAAKRAKELAAATAKQTAELKKQALAKKQQGLFDVQQAGIIAALQGNITKEERLRLELQLALLTGNETQAKKLSDQLAMSIDKTGQLKIWLNTLPDAKNPFAGWDAWLTEFQKKLAATQAFTISGGATARGESFASLNPTVSALVSGVSGASAGSTKGGDVYISIGGSVVSEQDLVSAVQNGLQYNSLAGKPSDIGRIAGMFG